MKTIAMSAALVLAAGITAWLPSADPVPFKRGDVNADGKVNIADPIWVMNALFLAGPQPFCESSADANDDGQVNATDALYLVTYLFLHGPGPADPFAACGADPTGDELTCDAFTPCR